MSNTALVDLVESVHCVSILPIPTYWRLILFPALDEDVVGDEA
jgi:hypothetical protein